MGQQPLRLPQSPTLLQQRHQHHEGRIVAVKVHPLSQHHSRGDPRNSVLAAVDVSLLSPSIARCSSVTVAMLDTVWSIGAPHFRTHKAVRFLSLIREY